VRVMSSFEHKPSPIERPRCPRCQTRMLLARRIQISISSEKRTFDCPKCTFIETQIADDPLKSKTAGWLSGELGQTD
jgi:hypothetical protein